MKWNNSSNSRHYFILSWLVGTGAWGILSYILLAEYKRIGESIYLTDLFFLLSILWVQFGFAGIFNAIYTRRYGRVKAFVAITLVPPLTVYFLVIL
jgi:hypothetical protein